MYKLSIKQEILILALLVVAILGMARAFEGGTLDFAPSPQIVGQG